MALGYAMPSRWGLQALSTTRRVTVLLVSLASAFAGVGVDASQASVPRVSGDDRVATSGVEDVARGLIVKTTTSSPSDALLSATDAALGGAAEVATDAALAPQVSTIGFDEVIDADVATDVAAEVEARPDVVWAIPDRLRRVQGGPPVSTNDPLFAQQRNLWDAAAGRSGGYSIKAPALWQASKGSASTVVAVIDTGVLAHPDLAGKIVPGYDFISSAEAARDGDGRDSDPTDVGDWNVNRECPYPGATASSWHGTFVAGQIAASTDNGDGIAGVAPGVVVQPVRALGRCGGWDSDILDSLVWASGGSVAGVPANPTPAPVVNLSFAGLASSARERTAACRVYNEVARSAATRGSLFIAAAGNEGSNANRAIPASCSEFVSVGAISRKGFTALYSNVGSTVDLAAPGGDTQVGGRGDSVISLGNAGTTTAGANGYVRYEGTSMAAPQVAGAAALLHGLGFTTSSSLRSALYASVSPFRARSSAYARKKVRVDRRTVRVDLNCTTRRRHWCGRGQLDLSRVQAPVSPPTIGGTLRIGEPLSAASGGWVSPPASIAYTWRADGAVVGAGLTYQPTSADVGKQLTVSMAPAGGVFTRLSATSAPTAAVPPGPDVSLRVSSTRVAYGSAFAVDVSAAGPGFVDGAVEIRARDGSVLGRGTSSSGTAQIVVAGRSLTPGVQEIRAAYLGDGAGSAPASSAGARVTIDRLAASVSTSLPSRTQSTSSPSITVKVLERPNLLADPTGELVVYDGRRRIATARLDGNDRGRATIRLPRLAKGDHRIRVRLVKSDLVASTYSVRRTIRSR